MLFQFLSKLWLGVLRTSGSRVHEKNVLWNILGNTSPLVAALVCIPGIINSLSLERYGVFSLILILVGYFSLLDLGVSRALTRRMAVAFEREDCSEPSIVFASALGLLLALAGFLIIVLSASSSFISGLVTDDYAGNLYREVRQCFGLVAIGIPAIFIYAAAKGTLESLGRFSIINKWKMTEGILNFLGPLCILQVQNSLIAVTVFVVCQKYTVALIFFREAAKRGNLDLTISKIDFAEIRQLVGFGAWVSVSNSVSPLMANLDRVLVGVMTSPTSLAIYSTVHDIIYRLGVLPAAFNSVLYPEASRAGGEVHLSKLYGSFFYYITAMLIVACLIIAHYHHAFFSWWINSDFADASSVPTLILLIGMYLNCIARINFTVIQAAGRPDLVAKIHAAEILPYLLLFYLLVDRYGINGAALSWSVRSGVDFILMHFGVSKVVPHLRVKSMIFTAATFCIACVLYVLSSVEALPLTFGFRL